MLGNKWWAVLSAGALSLACAGKAEQGGPAGSGPGAGQGNGAAANGGAPNGAVTAELRETGLPASSVLGQLDVESANAVCKALNAWQFRLRAPICDAFVESAVVLTHGTLEEERQLCADNRSICHEPTEPASGCPSYPASCQVTLAELDRCYADMEQWLDAVPDCGHMTFDRAYPIGPTPDSCTKLNSTCQR